jgi:hypothetical protein
MPPSKAARLAKLELRKEQAAAACKKIVLTPVINTPTKRLWRQLSSAEMVQFVRQTWPAEEIVRIVQAARAEPAFKLVHGREFKSVDQQKLGLVINNLCGCLFVAIHQRASRVKRQRACDALLKDHDFKARPERVLLVPSVKACLKRWGASEPKALVDLPSVDDAQEEAVVSDERGNEKVA